jgi:hypothetical protein
LKTAGSQTVTATDTVTPSITGSAILSVTADGLYGIIISPKFAIIPAGSSQTYSTSAFDQYNNSLGSVAATYSASAGASVSGSLVSSILAGSYTVTAFFNGRTDAASLTVTADGLDHIVISPKTATIVVGASQAYSTTGFDRFGNSLGFLGATYSVSAGATVSGNLVFSTLPGIYSVTATLSAKTDTATLTVTAAKANQLIVSATPSSVLAGSSVSVNVTAIDVYGNRATGYAGTLYFTSSDGLASLPSNSTLPLGTGMFSVTLKTAGLQTVTATDTVTPSITGTSNAVTVNVPSESTSHFVVSTPATVLAGATFIVNVTAEDQFGNRITEYSGTIHFASTSTGTLPSNSALPGGTGVFNVILASAGSQNLTVTDTVNPSINGSATLTVTGYTVTFTENGLPLGTAWNITFGSTLYSSTTNKITINGVSAITIAWNTSTYIQLAQTRYAVNQTSGSINVPAQLSQNITYQTQYLVTYAAKGNVLAVAVPSSEWVNSSGSATGVFPALVVNSQGDTRCNFINDNRTSITQPTTILATYKTQYYLTVTSTYGTVNGAGWYDNGTTATATVTSGTVSGVTGVQYLFTVWSGDASGSALTSSGITMNNPKTAIANWKTQYYLTLISTYGNPSGQGWYDAGSAASISVGQTTVGGASTRNVFTAWIGSGLGSYTGSATTQSVTMNGPITETASWTTQNLVTYAATGNVISVTLPSNEWVSYGAPAKSTFPLIVTNQANDTQCLYIQDDRPSTITQPTTVTADYQTQFKVTFDQTGIASDSKGTILSTFSPAENFTQLPATLWINNHSTLDFTFADNIPSTVSNKIYTLTGTNATSPITIDMPTLIQGNYKPQFSSTLVIIAEFFIIILALLLLLLLLLAYRRRRKKKQAEVAAKPSPTPQATSSSFSIYFLKMN